VIASYLGTDERAINRSGDTKLVVEVAVQLPQDVGPSVVP
jgi:hypothetical protein